MRSGSAMRSGFRRSGFRRSAAILPGGLRRLVVLVAWGCGAGGPPAPAAEHHGLEPVRFINERIAAGWADAGLRPSAAATDGEWCRRVHLDLVGRIPTVAELRRFLAAPASARRPELVARLLGPEYDDEYARHWTDVWTTALIGRDTTNELVDRAGMRQWLRQALAGNMPYDRFMEELVTARGVNADRRGVEGFNGATNFLSGAMAEMGVENGVQATAKTAQIFLGVQVQCTQCHNHPFNKGRQNQFWELNAFFRQTQVLRRRGGGPNVQYVELVDADWPGEGGDAEEAELYYELRNGIMKVAFPVFVDGTEISRQGWLPAVRADGTPYGVHRRQELARLIRTSPLFPRALVNRMWSRFLGSGFTRPVDDLGDHNPPSHPDLLDGLAERFVERSFDLKELMRWIVLAEPYALSSRPARTGGGRGAAGDDPPGGEPPQFSRFALRQMEAEQLYESLLTATRADLAASAEEAARVKDAWMSRFIIAFGTDEGDETTTFNGSIPQVLMMFNGDLVTRATACSPGTFLHQVAGGEARFEAKIRELYLAALARGPAAAELRMAGSLLAARGGDVGAALEDVWWAVLNSNEFILNH
jgi:hypothetical protein